MKIVKTKSGKLGQQINLCETTSKSGREYFALGKRYWIAYGDGSPRRSLNCSDSLRYINKKFTEIS
jgi:hypothetical protein